MFDQLRNDYHRHGSTLLAPAFWTLAVYRFGRWSLRLRVAPLRWLMGKLYGLAFLWNEILTGNNLHREIEIGGDFHIIHSGSVRLHPQSVIGDRVGIMHNVTLGTNMERLGAPRIGNDVFIGCGAVILGDVTIGDGARIAANSLVLSDVPPGMTAIGVPARVMNYTGRKAGEDSVATESTNPSPPKNIVSVKGSS